MFDRWMAARMAVTISLSGFGAFEGFGGAGLVVVEVRRRGLARRARNVLGGGEGLDEQAPDRRSSVEASADTSGVDLVCRQEGLVGVKHPPASAVKAFGEDQSRIALQASCHSGSRTLTHDDVDGEISRPRSPRRGRSNLAELSGPMARDVTFADDLFPWR